MWEEFVEALARHFRFLELEFGFRPKPAKPPFAIYETEKLQVLVYYDANGRRELDLRIRNLSDDTRKTPAVGMTEIMLLADWRAAEKYQSPFPSTEASLETDVQWLAELVRKYGSAFLKGDERAFERIERLRRERVKELGPKLSVNREEQEEAYQFMAGYFHQDFSTEFGEPENAVSTFIRESSFATRDKVVRQLRTILNENSGDDLDRVLLADLGCFYVPAKHRGITARVWLEEVVTELQKSL